MYIFVYFWKELEKFSLYQSFEISRESSQRKKIIKFEYYSLCEKA